MNIVQFGLSTFITKECDRYTPKGLFEKSEYRGIEGEMG